MDWWEAILLGAVEGLTEYLPVSSTGHLILVQRALGIESGVAANAFAVCVQMGAIIAVLEIYRTRVVQMARGLVGREPQGQRLALAIFAAFVPAAIVGPFFADDIEEMLFGLWPIVVAWLVGGLLILRFANRGRREDAHLLELEQLGLRPAFWIGVLQCIAMWPGTSRSLVTIVAGLIAGLRLSAAVEFSFLLGVVTLSAATGYKIVAGGGRDGRRVRLARAVVRLPRGLALRSSLRTLDGHVPANARHAPLRLVSCRPRRPGGGLDPLRPPRGLSGKSRAHPASKRNA